MIEYIILYVLGSLIIAMFGANRKLGFWGYFFASLLFSPFIGIILFFASDKRKKPGCC
ncbi:MAG: hypothetical protein HQK88_13920 [Nitrospirae bacterium]|nr:hypothetical protein [Nitrospirota bacterium]MBF0535980.1 hypothetical protein [Nitrospirota bacterium]MBF0617899.1 hypothetical protein [Nitrospirota bacterium]